MGRITVDIRRGDITKAKAAAIVNAANSGATMGGGVARAIRRAGGRLVEDEAVAQAPIPVGMAVATTAGHLPHRYVIHAATMRRPRQRIPHENVAAATRAAVETADRLGCESLAMPGLGTRTGKVPCPAAAREMLRVIDSFRSSTLRHVILNDLDTRMVDAWRKARTGDNGGTHHNRGRGERRGARTRAPARRRHPGRAPRG